MEDGNQPEWKIFKYGPDHELQFGRFVEHFHTARIQSVMRK